MTLSDLRDLTEAHIASIEPQHTAAFAQPATLDYAVGAVVWMSDHYNTATVTGSGPEGTWHVVTTDDDGTSHEYDCEADDLRPAPSRVEFRWPTTESA